MDLNHVRFHAARPQPRTSRRIARDWRGRAATADTGEPVGALPAHILRCAGLDPSAYRAAPLRRRTAACLRALRVDSEAAARERIADDRPLARLALSNLMLGVTSFFRDEKVFEVLHTVVLPALAKRSTPVRVLSAGCATGAELYSVAMLLDEAQMLDGARLLGVDCRTDAVTGAMAARFDDASLSTLPPEWRARCFEPANGGCRVAERLRRRTEWAVMDITRTIPPGPWDIVLCRNLLMYLQGDFADSACRRLVASLAPGGILVLGKAERPPALLPLAPLARCVYRTDEA